MQLVTKMCAAMIALTMAGCAFGTGIQPVAPGVYALQEFRAPALGGGPQAQQLVLLEADAFCRRQGRVFTPITMSPVGNPYGIYGPSGFDATFRCLPQTAPIATAPTLPMPPAP